MGPNVAADRSISREEFRQYKYDLRYSERSALVASVQQMLALNAEDDEKLRAAQAQLKQWDYNSERANRGAALALLATTPVIRAQEAKLPVPDLRESLLAAANTLKQHFGRLDPEWAEVNRIVRGETNLALDGSWDSLRSVWGEAQEDGTLKAVAGDTYILFVEWDQQGKLSSDSIHQFGSATLDDSSPHFADQLPLFVEMKTKPVWFTEAQLAGHIQREYRPASPVQ